LRELPFRLAIIGYGSEALRAASTVSSAEAQGWALRTLALGLVDRDPKLSIAAAVVIGEAEQKAATLTELADRLPVHLREEVLKELAGMKEEWVVASAFATLVPRLPEQLLGEVMEAASTIQETAYRLQVLRAFADRLPELARDTAESLWKTLVHHMATRSRAEALADVSVCFHPLKTIAGAHALMETAAAVTDVGNWWP
jgi:hypothetical protein